MMYCGTKSMAAVVDGPHLIKWLDIERPYSPTYGDVRDARPFQTTHKGMRFYFKPQADDLNTYAIEMRGSLAKYANAGHHVRNVMNPFDLLRALDELVTDLRINPFDTLLNNLEVTTTIRVKNGKQIIDNILAYHGERPKRKRMDNGLWYAKLETTHHSLKIYEPAEGLLRIELHANRMASLGKDRPHTLADLARPQFAAPMSNRLLAAFNRILWNCAGVMPDTLPHEEGYLLAKGRDPTYWDVNQEGITKSEYDRLRKQRERERVVFKEIVASHWTGETPAQLANLMQHQLRQQTDIMHSEPYKKALRTCWERWQIVANLPVWATLPKRPQWFLLSQTYRSSIGSPATTVTNALTESQVPLYKEWPTVEELYHQPETTDRILEGHKPHRSKSKRTKENREQKAHHRLRNALSNGPNNMLRSVRKLLNAPGGLDISHDDLQPLLSERAKSALAYSNQQLGTINQSSKQLPKPMPLFPAYGKL